MRKLCVLMIAVLAISAISLMAFAQDDRASLPQRTQIIVDRFTSFENTSVEMEEAILDTFAVVLQNDPIQVGYIIVYAGQNACAGEAQRRGMRMKKYLVERRGIEWNRVIWRDGGYLEKPYVLLEMQVRGAEPYPYSYPATLQKSEVTIRNCKATAGRRRRRG